MVGDLESLRRRFFERSHTGPERLRGAGSSLLPRPSPEYVAYCRRARSGEADSAGDDESALAKGKAHFPRSPAA